MANKKQDKKKYIIAGVCAGVVAIIAIVIAVVLLTPPKKDPYQEAYDNAEAMRLDAIAQQIRIKAESYHDAHGEWPESLADIHETEDRLPSLVFNSFKNMGFLLSYIGVDGERIVYCSEDLAQTSLGQNNCPKR